MYRSAVFFVFTLSLFSCQQDFLDEEIIPQQADDIPSELQPYFVSFQAEAEKHGLLVNYADANVTAEIYNIDEGSVAGSCTTNGHTLRHIRIDQSFWDRAPNLTREMVIFHELGHCLLGRSHREDTFGNGICKSIMRSGLGSCRDAYSPENRAYFIEELFRIGN